MYAKNAVLFHRPMMRIAESSMPALAAAVTAPILKLNVCMGDQLPPMPLAHDVQTYF